MTSHSDSPCGAKRLTLASIIRLWHGWYGVRKPISSRSSNNRTNAGDKHDWYVRIEPWHSDYLDLEVECHWDPNDPNRPCILTLECLEVRRPIALTPPVSA
ncbi:MAG: hypothetical protein KatS3mg015_2908 [Fimbriimonadales bacterium]|nr:MAG: hypothetical protein KatS3mg015_2908 [Fimbriimonadales bacterium]